MADFLAIDYETANSMHESVCAIGVTVVEGGRFKSNFYSLVKPPKECSHFDSFNVSIHGISNLFSSHHVPLRRGSWSQYAAKEVGIKPILTIPKENII